MPTWIDPSPVEIPKFLAEYDAIVAKTLTRRGIKNEEAALAFLSAEHYTPAPASALPDLDSALERIQRAIRQGERILIWGDFDVDGQTATSLLYQTLTALRANVTYHIPNRARESHGVHLERLKEHIDAGAQLILTCDTGISAHDAVIYAHKRGVDFVITDHHDLSESLPPARAVINPKRLPETHPLASLAGVGVAYKLAEALLAAQPTDLNPETLLDLAALGLVADLATLTGDTRYLVQCGLEQIRRAERLGINILLEKAGIKPQSVNESHLSFALAPRLNALGRLEDANPAVELLTTQDETRARVLAQHLEGLNLQRKLLCDQITMAAEAQLRENPALLAAPMLILEGKAWPGGVTGIVASRLVERYGKPAMLFTLGEDGIARGSARSIDGFHITEAIRAQSDLLTNFGGHPMAAGLGLLSENLPDLRRRLNQTAARMLAERHITEATLPIDEWINLSEISDELAAQIKKIAPFGPGNPHLTLATRNLTLKTATPVGRGAEHVRLTVADDSGQTQSVLWWGGGNTDLPSERFDLAYTIRTNDYKGQKQVTAELVDLREYQREKITVTGKKFETVDRREAEDPRRELETIRGANPESLVWAEGADKKQVEGMGRHELRPAFTLVIWTTPASPASLRAALEQVKPQKVVLLAQNPPESEPEAFLTRLTGLVKHVVKEKNSQTSLAELAAACAQDEAAIRLGLEALGAWNPATGRPDANGNIQITLPADGKATINGPIRAHLSKILGETQAYREHFCASPRPLEGFYG